MCGSMADIQSPTAEIRRGKKKERKNDKRQDENIYGLPYYIGSHKIGIEIEDKVRHVGSLALQLF